MLLRLAFLLALSSCSRATAAPELPARMNLGDAARLDRDLTHLAQLRQEIARYEAEAAEVCTMYKIEPRELGRTVGVNFTTGEITRTAGPPQKEASK